MQNPIAPVRRPFVLSLALLGTAFVGGSWVTAWIAWLGGWRSGWVSAGAWRVDAAAMATAGALPAHLGFAACLAMAVGLARRRRWARPLLVGGWLLAPALGGPAGGAEWAPAAVGAALTALYLTSSRAARAYFITPGPRCARSAAA